ncbi:MAG: dihydroorotate dehydrogenase electron transfer subunit [Hungatella sp.]|nr:dihydroorotate dehydrogenase electron transfer subunit [Hungatella sp.]
MLELGKIIENRPVAKDIYEMVLNVPKIAKEAKPGQFVNLRLSDKLDPLLRRPISIHDIDSEKGTISMLYLIVGKGTAMMRDMEPGTDIDVLGPLGNGWNCGFEGKYAVLIGGGIGIAPLYPLAKALTDAGKTVELIVGAKNQEYLTDLSAYEKTGVQVTVTTDDGSAGLKGFVTEALTNSIQAGTCDHIYACGPLPMLKSVEKLAVAHHKPGQVSTESHMGCGLGICLLCPSKVTEGGYKRTCTDGPVFEIGELDYE